MGLGSGGEQGPGSVFMEFEFGDVGIMGGWLRGEGSNFAASDHSSGREGAWHMHMLSKILTEWALWCGIECARVSRWWGRPGGGGRTLSGKEKSRSVRTGTGGGGPRWR